MQKVEAVRLTFDCEVPFTELKPHFRWAPGWVYTAVGLITPSEKRYSGAIFSCRRLRSQEGQANPKPLFNLTITLASPDLKV